jgi:hypothetical protein
MGADFSQKALASKGTPIPFEALAIADLRSAFLL